MSWGSDMRVWIPSMETGHIHPCISLDGYKTRTPNLGSPERMQLFVLYTIFNQNLFSDEWNQKVCGWLKKIHTHHIYTCSHITQSHTHNTYMHIPHTHKYNHYLLFQALYCELNSLCCLNVLETTSITWSLGCSNSIIFSAPFFKYPFFLQTPKTIRFKSSS